MRFRFLLPALFAGIIVLFQVTDSHAQNSINGIVFDESRRPVPSIVVELLDELERLSKSTTTNGSGLFMFNNLRSGVYYVRIRVAGTPFLESKERLQIGSTNITRNGNVTGSESRQLNFHLRAAKRRVASAPAGVVFAQSVPAEAMRLYESGVELLKKGDKDSAAVKFEAALSVFPGYFLADIELGKIYFDRGEFTEATKLFRDATTVNPASYAAFWGLGLSLQKLDKKKQAIEALNAAVEINRESVDGHLVRGVLFRELGKFNDALQSLLLAKKFAKKSSSEVHWNLALLYYYNLGDPGNAADELELYIEAIPKSERTAKKQKIELVKQLIEKMRKQEK